MKEERILDNFKKTLAGGGATFRVDKDEIPTKGYIVALSGWEEKIPLEQFTLERLVAYVQRNERLLNDLPTIWVGTWVNYDENIVYLDLSNNYLDLKPAIRAGKAGNQLAIWDVENMKYITL